MRITEYCLKHPLIALVLNVMVAVIGCLSLYTLSIREYPKLHLPEVFVHTSYPNASAEVVEHTVTNVLEEALAGLEGLESISSYSRHGHSQISLSFENTLSMDKVVSAVREECAAIRFPSEVKAPVIERGMASSDMPFMLLALESNVLSFGELTHYATIHLKNGLKGLPGVASSTVWGQPYLYEIELSAEKLYLFGVNADEVWLALKKTEDSLAVGKFQNTISATLTSALKTEEDYENLLVKENVTLKQVAKVRLKTDDTSTRIRVNGKAGVAVAIAKSKDANPLEVSQRVRAQLQDIQLGLLDDVKMSILADQAGFVRAALDNLRSSFLEAILCVALVVFVFLKSIRASIVPLVAIPLSMLGSFFCLKAFGCSMNTMTLLAMVLAVGLVVDDAIVVLENIERHLEKGCSPLEAALRGSREIGFAIVAMTGTLMCVYAPLFFMQGPSGVLFTEFAVALAGSVCVSGFVALSLTPFLCAKTLRKRVVRHWPLWDEGLAAIQKYYSAFLRKNILRVRGAFFCFLGIGALIVLFLKILPYEHMPREDRNLMGVYIPMNSEKSIEKLYEKVVLVEKQVQKLSEVQGSIVLMGDWGANIMLPLKNQSLRGRSAQVLVEVIRTQLSELPSLTAYPWSDDFGLPGLEKRSDTGMLSLVLSTTESYSQLCALTEKASKVLEKEGLFQSVGYNVSQEVPQYIIHLDTNELEALQLTKSQIAKTIEIFFSGDKSLSFFKEGLSYKLLLKARRSPWTMHQLYVTNPLGKRISLGVVASLDEAFRSESIYHYNQMRSVIFHADPFKSQDIKTSMQLFLEKTQALFPVQYKKTWIGASKAYERSQEMALVLFFLALLFIFAILCIQFENLSGPCIILMTVPLACVGALFFLWIFGLSLNMYTQIGLITLVGLITKHGILMVDFADSLAQTMEIKEAVIKAASLRFRPILMTTCAMVFGALPLVFSHQAGHEVQQAIGVVLVGGLVFGTVFTLFLLPMVYVAIKK